MGRQVRPIQLLFAAVIFCAGCGGDGGPAIYPVKGKVTKGGQPLAGVLVTFTPEAGGASSSGQTNESGQFVLLTASGKSGAPAGKHKVTITVTSSGGGSQAAGQTDWAKMAAERDAKTKGGPAGAPAEEKKDDKVPAEYSDPAKSPLPAYEVKSGNNDFDIAIP